VLAGNEITLQEYFDSLAKTQKPASVISEEVAAQTYKQEQVERPAMRPEATATSSSATAGGSQQVRHCRLFLEGFL
jgi:selenocysteine lyase/cysteine desulfurase